MSQEMQRWHESSAKITCNDHKQDNSLESGAWRPNDGNGRQETGKGEEKRKRR